MQHIDVNMQIQIQLLQITNITANFQFTLFFFLHLVEVKFGIVCL